VIVIEPVPERFPNNDAERDTWIADLRALALAQPLTAGIGDFLFHRRFPVDIRHNAKIFREQLAVWAESVLEPPAAATRSART
jgi:hypothetical protein